MLCSWPSYVSQQHPGVGLHARLTEKAGNSAKLEKTGNSIKVEIQQKLENWKFNKSGYITKTTKWESYKAAFSGIQMSRRAGNQESNGTLPPDSTNLEWPFLYTHSSPVCQCLLDAFELVPCSTYLFTSLHTLAFFPILLCVLLSS